MVDFENFYQSCATVFCNLILESTEASCFWCCSDISLFTLMKFLQLCAFVHGGAIYFFYEVNI